MWGFMVWYAYIINIKEGVDAYVKEKIYLGKFPV